jgi:hypothetical protein
MQRSVGIPMCDVATAVVTELLMDRRVDWFTKHFTHLDWRLAKAKHYCFPLSCRRINPA